MNNENEFGKIFRFSLRQGDVLLCEKMIDSSDFSPEVRYPINIKSLLPKIINHFQKVLSKKYYETCVYVGNEYYYDLYAHMNENIASYGKDIQKDLVYNPDIVTYQIHDAVEDKTKTIKGVPCTLGFYVNDKTIVERIFYVNGFNPVCRYSVDVVDAVKFATSEIYNHLKKCDIEYISNEYESQYHQEAI